MTYHDTRARFLSIVAYYPAMNSPSHPNTDVRIYWKVGQAVEHFAPDWIQYAHNAWLLWTRADAKVWAERTKNVTPDQYLSVFVQEVDFGNQRKFFGFLQEQVWTWINTARDASVTVNEDVTNAQLGAFVGWGKPQF